MKEEANQWSELRNLPLVLQFDFLLRALCVKNDLHKYDYAMSEKLQL